MSALHEAVVDVLVTKFNFDRDEVLAETPFQELGFDSLARVELAIVLESRLGVPIDEEDTFDLSNVSEVVDMLQRKGVHV